MIILRPYNTAGSVTFTMRQAGSDAFATSSHWTPAAGDVKLSLDGGAQANATNLPTFANGQWTLSLADTELQAARVRINIDDVDIIPESILIETYGHASAAYPTAYADQWLGIASKITSDHGVGSYVDTGPGLDATGVRTAVGLASANLDTQLAAIPTVAPLDATATEAAALAAVTSYAPAQPGDAMTLTTGERAAVRSDLLTETVYGQSLPANFGTLVIGGDGVVDASVEQVAGVGITGVADFQADVSGLLTKTQFDAALPTNFGVLSIDTSGNVTATGGGSGGATAQEVWEYGTRELTSIDLSGVEVNALTPEQATWLEETHEKAMLIGTGGAFVETPIDGDSNITVRRARDYQQADGLAIEWSNPDGTWPDLTGATIVARVARPGCKTSALYDFAASVVTPTGSQIVRLELTKAQLAIIADDYTYELVATLSGGSVVTLVDGQFRVILGRDAP